MRVITISREFGSGGREMGKRLADTLGVPCYDHEIIDMIAERYGFDKNYVAHVSEGDIRAWYPSTIGHRFAVRKTADQQPVKVAAAEHEMIRRLASQGDCVIVGRCSDACVFLFSVVDGIFVGNGAGIQALGAVNLALPFVLGANALNAMASIGGVTITAIRFGRGDKEGAENAFMHSLTINLCVGLLITLTGCAFTGPVCGLLGASESYLPLVREYVFWWALFAAANSLSLNLQSFCLNDDSPGLVAATNIVSAAVNIFLDWLFVFPLQMGVMGAAAATGISQIVGLLIISKHFAFHRGALSIRRFRPQIRLFRKIAFRGLPEAVARFSTPVTTLCMNRTLMAAFLRNDGNPGLAAKAVLFGGIFNVFGDYFLYLFWIWE